jgi:hypothetical protein
VSNQQTKPVLDEQALGRLLEAAFVLQEHNREQQELDLNLELHSNHLREQETKPSRPQPPGTQDGDSKNDYTLTLAQIVETQRQIQVRHLDLESAMSLVAERIVAITRAAGAAIGIIDGKKVRYRAAAAAHVLPLGTEVPMDKALCHACLRVGQVIRCTDVNPEFLFDAQECSRRGIQSLIAVPIYHDGEIAGALELYFASVNAFTEQDVHSCQLIAGLVTEAFARNDEITWKKSLAAERATMLDVLEKVKPNLAALLGSPANKGLNLQSTDTNAGRGISADTIVCRKCGHELVAEEQFCGECGAPRLKDTEPTVAPPAANPVSEGTEPAETLDDELLASLHADLEADLVHSPADSVHTPEESPEELVRRLTKPESPTEADTEKETPATTATETALVRTEDDITWSSAARARDFFEQLAAGRDRSAFARFWNARRGDIYLAVAVLLVAVVIRWGIWSNHSVSATGGPTATATHRRPAPDADLSMLDKMLISLGLAEAPEAPEYRGNPETQVWVDLHTALYYCPGTDLYGKTPRGKYTTQRDAQLDQFEPASRKACD